MAYYTLASGRNVLQTLDNSNIYEARKKAIKLTKTHGEITIRKYDGPEYRIHEVKWEVVYISDMYGPMVMTKPTGAENFRKYRLSEKTGKLLDVNYAWKYL